MINHALKCSLLAMLGACFVVVVYWQICATYGNEWHHIALFMCGTFAAMFAERSGEHFARARQLQAISDELDELKDDIESFNERLRLAQQEQDDHC